MLEDYLGVLSKNKDKTHFDNLAIVRILVKYVFQLLYQGRWSKSKLIFSWVVFIGRVINSSCKRTYICMKNALKIQAALHDDNVTFLSWPSLASKQKMQKFLLNFSFGNYGKWNVCNGVQSRRLKFLFPFSDWSGNFLFHRISSRKL